MQLSDRQGSHSRASSSAQSLPLAFTRGLLASNGPNSGKQFSRPFQSAQNSPLGSHSHKRAHVPFSVSEPSDSPLKRRLMRESGSDGNLKGLPVRAELLKKPNVGLWSPLNFVLVNPCSQLPHHDVWNDIDSQIDCFGSKIPLLKIKHCRIVKKTLYQ